jgi:hypothetical protein
MLSLGLHKAMNLVEVVMVVVEVVTAAAGLTAERL